MTKKADAFASALSPLFGQAGFQFFQRRGGHFRGGGKGEGDAQALVFLRAQLAEGEKFHLLGVGVGAQEVCQGGDVGGGVV